VIDQRKILSTGSRARIIASAAVIISALFSGMRGSGFAQEIFVAHPALTFGDIPYYIAREKNFYRDEGFQVKDFYIRGGVTASQALQAGRSISRWRLVPAFGPHCPE
jgi:ABC-type nitrate/sulfonate/bicarbonate transport system substrate-binding protein